MEPPVIVNACDVHSLDQVSPGGLDCTYDGYYQPGNYFYCRSFPEIAFLAPLFLKLGNHEWDDFVALDGVQVELVGVESVGLAESEPVLGEEFENGVIKELLADLLSICIFRVPGPLARPDLNYAGNNLL